MPGLGHIAVGLAVGRFYSRRIEPEVTTWKAMVAFSALSALPDLDVLAFKWGIAYHHPFGHRGAFHSIVVAVILALLSAGVAKASGLSFRRVLGLALVVTLSHGLLDTLTNGGLGIALLWPFDDTRFFFPWRPIPVGPIGRGIFSWYGLKVTATEALLFSPFLLYAFWPKKRSPART